MGDYRQANLPVFFLMGPTASGKTQLAVELATRLPVDVLSVDAGQVYRGMDIGTAKPTPEILARVPHRLIDICTPWEHYSAGQFRRDALVEINSSIKRGRIPLLVGGTSFYFHTLETGLSVLPPRSETVSQRLKTEAEAKGWSHLYKKLLEVDEYSARQISPNDRQRLLRLLEIYLITGQRPSIVKQQSSTENLPYKIIKIAVAVADREGHNDGIQQRFGEMLERGFLQEAEALYQADQFDQSLPAMRCVGYQQAWQYFEGQINYEQMVQDSIRETVKIAKRQLTWVRNQGGVIWSIFQNGIPIADVTKVIAAFTKCNG